MFSTRSLTSASLLCGLGLFTTLVIMTAAVPSLQPTTAASTQMPSIQDADPLTIWKERLAAESPGSWIASTPTTAPKTGEPTSTGWTGRFFLGAWHHEDACGARTTAW